MMKDLQEAHTKEVENVQVQKDEVILDLGKQIEVLQLDVATAKILNLI